MPSSICCTVRLRKPWMWGMAMGRGWVGLVWEVMPVLVRHLMKKVLTVLGPRSTL